MTGNVDETAGKSVGRWEFWVLALVLGVLFTAGLGRRPLANPDEGRYAEIPREMVATGDWVTPRLDGVKYFEKPPLGYWMVAVAQEVLGEGEWSVRLMPAVSAWFGCLLTYAAARRLWGRRVGLLAAGVLATSLLYFAMSQLLILDMLVGVLISAALFCFVVAVRLERGAERRGWFYGVYVAAALATLAKGLIGFLLPGAVIFCWLLIFNQWRRLLPFYLPTGLLLFLAVAGPWHALVMARNPDFAWFYFVHEHFLRYTTDIHGRDQPWWFFGPVVLLGLFPWPGFLWPAAREILAGGWARRRERAVEGFLFVWAGVIVLFFSTSHSKLIPYMVPVLPPLAVLIARELDRRLGGGRLAGASRVAAWVSLGVMAVLAVLLPIAPRFAHIPGQAEALQPYGWGGGVWLGLAVVAGVWALCRGWTGRLMGALGGGAAGLMLILVLAGGILQKPGTKALAAVLVEEAGPADAIYTYHDFFHDLPYYTRRMIGAVDYRGEMDFGIEALGPSERFIDEATFRAKWTGDRRIFVVAPKLTSGKLLSDPTFVYTVLAENRRQILISNRPQNP